MIQRELAKKRVFICNLKYPEGFSLGKPTNVGSYLQIKKVQWTFLTNWAFHAHVDELVEFDGVFHR